MRRALLTLALAAGLAATPSLAREFKITEQEARNIAAKHGIVRITEIERDDGNWEIEGRDAQGREIEMEIDGRTGELMEFERD